ncbi:WD repeat-containing protein 18 [Gracilariopsis chorda]|uniref:WD repeat-containing protein 18 n=1 Tax=Gracilariopsis chorda TaxID=448386 RepID=A0A2V3IZN1_9FLOR|nr:WD repeat-containing protein 18 [Gracilariopsis chorda]|eukprot:PXF47601.1 WD repeat-containing protein 18 [Gracilariopsis chorda]
MTYTILSVCSHLGTLHHHSPPHTTPFKTQQNCRPATTNCAALLPHALITSSQSQNSKNTTLTLHSLTRLPSRNFTPPEPISCVATSTSSNLLFAGGFSGRCYIWHIFTGRLLAVWDAHVGAVNAASFCDDDEAVLTAGADAASRLFLIKDVISTSESRPDSCLRLVGHTLPITCVAVGYAGASARVVTGSMDRNARIWHLASAKCVATLALSAPAVDVVLTSDEAAVFVALADGFIVCAHLHTLPLASITASPNLKRIHPPVQDVSAKCIALSPNDENLIVGYTDGIVRLYDAQSLQMVSVYAKHNTTASITAVLAAAPATSPEYPLFERVPERVLDPSIGETFRPLVPRNHGTRSYDMALSIISEAYDDAFTDESDDNSSDRLEGYHKELEARMRRENELLERVHQLQERNRQLRAASRKMLRLLGTETSQI